MKKGILLGIIFVLCLTLVFSISIGASDLVDLNNELNNEEYLPAIQGIEKILKEIRDLINSDDIEDINKAKNKISELDDLLSSYINQERKNDSEDLVTWTDYYTQTYEDFEANPISAHAKLFLSFKNQHSKTIKGLIYNVKLYDNFGDLLSEYNQRKVQVNIEPGEDTTIYYNYKKIPDFDIYSAILNETLIVELEILKVVDEDNKVITIK